MATEQRLRRQKKHRKHQRADKTAEHSIRTYIYLLRMKGGEPYVSTRMVWIWFLVDIPHHHDRNDDILLLLDEKARNELLDGLLRKR